MDPLELFPAELWQMIFENVEDSLDWLNLYRASSTFAGVVGDQRQNVLFLKVIPHLEKYLNDDLDDLLRLRLVSRHWKVAVDTNSETSECMEKDPRGLNKLQLKYNFEDSETIVNFLDKFGTHSGNPLIGGCVRVFTYQFPNNERELMEYKYTVERLMYRFGNHVKKLYFHSNDVSGITLDFRLDQFRSCVQMTPNLEELNIVFEGRNCYDDGTPLDVRLQQFLNSCKPEVPELEELTAVIRGRCVDFTVDNPILLNGPFPVISGLKSFSFAGHESFWMGLQNYLIRLCCNPDTLKRASVFGVPTELSAGFPKLEKVKLAMDLRPVDASNLENSRWPLIELNLSTREVDTTFVESVKNFKKTLTSLSFSCYGNPSAQFVNLSLDLSLLKFLCMPRQFISAKFLEQLRSLEKLVLFENDLLADKDCAQKMLLDVETHLSKSNVMKNLPKLKEVKIAGSHCDYKFVFCAEMEVINNFVKKVNLQALTNRK